MYPTLTVRANLTYFGRLAGLRGSALSSRTEEIAAGLAISDLVDRRVATLSGGQRRRVHVGVALMNRSTVLLLDEPTVGVDVGARDELLDVVRRTAEDGTAVLYSTHQLHEVPGLAARAVVIDHGRVLAAGAVTQIVAEHAPPLVELVLGRDDVELPTDLLAAVDESGWTSRGQYRVVARLADDDVSVADVVDHLGPECRELLVAASVLEPDLEVAYRRLLRGADR